MAAKKKQKAENNNDEHAESGAFTCPSYHQKPRAAAFAVAWHDGTATLNCPTHGVVTLNARDFAAQRERNRSAR